MKFKIIDWAYNRMFPNKTFKTSQDAFDFLLNELKEEELQDVFVVDIKTRCYANGYWSTIN